MDYSNSVSVAVLRCGNLTCSVRAFATENLYVGTVRSPGAPVASLTAHTLSDLRIAFEVWVERQAHGAVLH